MKEKIEKMKEELKWKYNDTKQWCYNHKSEIMVITPVLIPAVVELVKVVIKRGNISEEKKLKERFIYDRSMGHYYETKRKLKSSEWTMIDERRANGEALGEILKMMNLLK